MAEPAGPGLRVVVGVTGGIAAYKAASVVREFVRRGHSVSVIPTSSALRFVGAPTWEALSRNPVNTDLFDGVAEVTHVALGQQADLIVVAPATAHFLAQYRAGLASDLLMTTLLATSAKVLVAPAMHTEMWEHPATRENIEVLRHRGVEILGPESGELTGGDSGAGRMSEPGDIVDAALSLVVPHTLKGKKVLISAGGTREPLDPVRYIGNNSTGAMGCAIAHQARLRGAQVTLVHAHLEVDLPAGIESVFAPRAEDMLREMTERSTGADIVVMAAAVADWKAAEVSAQKLSKTDVGETFAPVLVRTVDVAAEIGRRKTAAQSLVVFAAQTESDDEQLLHIAQRKGVEKGADVVVANRVGHGLGFGKTETAVWFVRRSGAPVLSTGSKMSVAGHLLDVLLES